MRPFIAFRCLSLIALFALAAGPATRAVAADHGPNDPGQLAFTIPVPAGRVSLKQVHDAVLKAAIGRGWTVQKDQDMKIVIHLLHRRYDATVTFQITDKNIQAFCIGYKVNREGQRVKPEQPRSWLRYLQRDITKALNTAAYLDK